MNTKRTTYLKNLTLLALMLALTVIFCFVPISFGAITLALMILPTIIVAQASDFKTSLIMGLLMGIVNYIAWFTTKAANPVAPIFQNPIVCIVPRIMIAVSVYLVRSGLEKAYRLRLCAHITDEYVREAFDASPKNNDTINNEIENASAPTASTCDECDAFDFESKDADYIAPTRTKQRTKRDVAISQIIYAFSTAVGVVTNTLLVGVFTLLFFNGTSIAQNTVVTVEYVLAWFGLNFAIEVVSFSAIVPPIMLALKASKLVK